MLNQPVQNAPHSTRLPVARVQFRVAVEKTRGPLGWVLRSLAPLLFVLGVGGLVYGLTSDEPISTLLVGAGAALVVVVLVLWSFVALVLTRGPAREQQRYYELRQVKKASESQLDALRVLAASTHAAGMWSETLEYHPRDVGLTPRQRADLVYLDLASPAEFARQLDEDWGLLTEGDVRQMLDRTLSRSVHCREYAVLSAVGGIDHAERLAGLTNLSVSEIAATVVPSASGPAVYIWGYDLWRAASTVSNAYMAGILDEPTAWQYLLRCSDMVYALFPSEEAYLVNCRIGHAFWSNSLKATTDRRLEIEQYLASDWPLRSRPWPTRPLSVLPAKVHEGFGAEAAEAFSRTVHGADEG